MKKKTLHSDAKVFKSIYSWNFQEIFVHRRKRLKLKIKILPIGLWEKINHKFVSKNLLVYLFFSNFSATTRILCVVYWFSPTRPAIYYYVHTQSKEMLLYVCFSRCVTFYVDVWPLMCCLFFSLQMIFFSFHLKKYVCMSLFDGWSKLLNVCAVCVYIWKTYAILAYINTSMTTTATVYTHIATVIGCVCVHDICVLVLMLHYNVVVSSVWLSFSVCLSIHHI